MTNTKARSENPAVYLVSPAASAENAVIAEALAILARRVIGQAMDSPQGVKDYMRLRLAPLEHEEFACLFLDSNHRVLAFECMFRGTLTQTSVYPREVVKRALALNAGAVILAHNHPSGFTEPSRADKYLTTTLKSALALVDVRVLDHIVVGTSGCTSFAERGLI